MKKPEKPKTNAIGWMFAFIFPKKAKPIPPKSATTPLTPAAVPPPALFVPTPPPAQTAPTPLPAPAKSPVVMPLAPPPTPLPAAKTPTTKTDEDQKPGLFSFQPKKLFPAFWTITGGLSLLVNIILIITLIILARELFTLKRLVGGHVLAGLYDNFVLMDQANIKTDIKVQDTIPINFTLPISQDTVVVLTEPTYISNVMINLNSGGLSINSPANITLPAGTNLPVHLQLEVPVSAQIPITLNVPVDIPLDETELHEPFVGLQKVIGPFNTMLDPNLKTADDVPACKEPLFGWFCSSFFTK